MALNALCAFKAMDWYSEGRGGVFWKGRVSSSLPTKQATQAKHRSTERKVPGKGTKVHAASKLGVPLGFQLSSVPWQDDAPIRKPTNTLRQLRSVGIHMRMWRDMRRLVLLWKNERSELDYAIDRVDRRCLCFDEIKDLLSSLPIRATRVAMGE